MTRLHDSDIKKIFLKPGEIYIGERPAKVVTVLGSCVSVTIFSKRLRIGAICHGALPHCRKMRRCHDLCDDTFKYVDCSLHYMLGRMRSLGCADSEIEIKLFGGADTLSSKKENTIGSMNVKMALDIIRQENLRVIAADVGDSFGRKIFFMTHTGDVYLKRLINAAAISQSPGVTFKMRGK
ncbi:MAG: chemotaxis protein CheD [Nitrospirae bacterium]|nr:chemotaxis protein CheD [Nitrospirota bacterium]